MSEGSRAKRVIKGEITGLQTAGRQPDENAHGGGPLTMAMPVTMAAPTGVMCFSRITKERERERERERTQNLFFSSFPSADDAQSAHARPQLVALTRLCTWNDL